MKSWSITEARARFSAMLQQAGESVVQITERNRPKVALLDWGTYQSMLETLELLSDPDFTQALRQAENEAQDGETVDWEKVREELGL